MAHLIEDAPDARVFCEEVRAKRDIYKKFRDESFADLVDTVLSTTGLDSQGHAFTRRQLEGFADQVNNGLYWGGMHHDSRIHPVGRVLAAKVFYSPRKALYFLAAVIGYYNTQSLPRFSDLDIDLAALPEVDNEEFLIDATGPYATLALNPQEVDLAVFDGVADAAAGIVSSSIERQFRKAADLPTIVSVAVKLWLLAANPFSKKFLERYGEVAADHSLRFFAWLKDRLVSAITKLSGPKIRLEIDSDYAGCRLKFVIASNDGSDLTNGIATLRSAAASALSLAQALAASEPQQLVYEYDIKERRWLPLYATTVGRGVIAERPVSVTLEELSRMGLSIGGAVRSRRIEVGPEDDADIDSES